MKKKLTTNRQRIDRLANWLATIPNELASDVPVEHQAVIRQKFAEILKPFIDELNALRKQCPE